MLSLVILLAGALALAALFKLAGWSPYKSNAGTLAAAGIIVIAALSFAIKYAP